MEVIIAGGTGFVGQYLVKRYLAQGHQVTLIGRSKANIKQIFSDQVKALSWDDVAEQDFAILDHIDLIINLAGAGIADKRWSQKRREEIIQSRLMATKCLVDLCSDLGPTSPPLFNASAVGIYGVQPEQADGLPPALDESTPINFEHPPNFSSKIVCLWELATQLAIDQGVRVVNMRFGVVLGPGGGALARLLLPFKLFMGGKLGTGKQPFSWVAIEDLASVIDFLYKNNEMSGPINVVSPECVTQHEFARVLAHVLHRSCFMTTPAWMMRLVFGEMAEELLLSGQHVKPSSLLENGFVFQYPKLERALEFAVKKEKSL